MPESFIVENSAAPGAIGDTIASFPALQAYAWKSETTIDVWLSCAAARPLLGHHKINKLEERPEKAKILNVQAIASKHINTGWSMSQGYMEAIGLGDVAALKSPELSIDMGELPDHLQVFQVLLAPFSHSDNGTNTKIWPENRWANLILALRQRGLAMGLLGTQMDWEANPFWHDKPIKPLLNLPLQEVAWDLKFAGLSISVDNGINWITQGVKTNHLLFLPPTANPGWTGNRNGNAINCPVGLDDENATRFAFQLLGLK